MSKETILVQQKEGAKDCFIACMAMAEGVGYDEITTRLGDELTLHIYENGLYAPYLDQALDRVGWVKDRDYVAHRGFSGNLSFHLTPWLFARPAILQIDSANFENEQHMVYWDGYELFDPSLLLTFSKKDLKKGCNNVWLLSPKLRS